MSDSYVDPRERTSDMKELVQSSHDSRQAALHTAMPATIVSFDPEKMTAKVKPCISAFNIQSNGTRAEMQITQLEDVPVHFPGGGGHSLTFPVKPGDECQLLFQERSIDNWHQLGGTRLPNDWRMHDINDAICQVGVRSQPNTLSQKGGAVATDGVQLRSDDGKRYITIKDAGDEIDIIIPQVSFQIKDDSVTVVAPGKMRFETPMLEVTGEVKAMCDGGSVQLSTHTHAQPPDSHGDGEEETNQPTAGT